MLAMMFFGKWVEDREIFRNFGTEMDFTNLCRPYFRRVYLAEMKAGENPEMSQRRLLADLLRRAAHTRMGEGAGFGEIHSYEEFAERVPVSSYPEIRGDVMDMVQGASSVLWPGEVRRFAQSSGTSDGKSKYIPITPRSLSRCHYAGGAFSLASYLHHYGESHLFGGKNFILGGSFANELQLPPGVLVGDVSATLIDRINPLVNLFRIPRKEVALMKNWEEKIPALVEAASRADVRSLSGVPSWFLTVLRKVLERTGAQSLHDVWPNLEVFFHGGIAFGPYREQYARITDSSRMRYWENYNASEGFFGVQARPGSPEMRLLMNADTFYEFIPAANPSAQPVPVWKLEPGRIYALLVTSSNGLWRYPLGDTVKIHSTHPVEFTIAGRTQHYINVFGEEVMVFNTDAALAATCRATGAEAVNYTAAPVYAADGRRGRHQWLIEFATPPSNLASFAAMLDEALQRENSDYQAKRSGGLFLDPLTVEVAPAGLFDRWLASTGKLGGQRKIPRLANDRRFIDPMLAMLCSGS